MKKTILSSIIMSGLVLSSAAFAAEHKMEAKKADVKVEAKMDKKAEHKMDAKKAAPKMAAKKDAKMTKKAEHKMDAKKMPSAKKMETKKADAKMEKKADKK